jgi:hypothetical protein
MDVRPYNPRVSIVQHVWTVSCVVALRSSRGRGRYQESTHTDTQTHNHTQELAKTSEPPTKISDHTSGLDHLRGPPLSGDALHAGAVGPGKGGAVEPLEAV